MSGLADLAAMNRNQPGVAGNRPLPRKPVSACLCCFILFAACLFTLPVFADTYVGVKAGLMMVDVSSDRDPINLALNLGYRLDTRLVNTSLVGEVNRTLRDGETGRGDDLEFESDAVYLVLRTPRSMFVSARGGWARDKVISGGDVDRNDGLLWGVSIGGIVGKTLIHLEYTSIAGDAEFLALSIEF